MPRAYYRCMVAVEYNSHRKELAGRIKALRIEQGYSIRNFSLMIGISKTHLANVESAQASPTFDMLERIAAGLNTKVSDLVTFK